MTIEQSREGAEVSSVKVQQSLAIVPEKVIVLVLEYWAIMQCLIGLPLLEMFIELQRGLW